MATKRMFSKDVVRTDRFLDMGLSAQALYFHLCLDADAKGFVTPRSIMRLINATVGDLNNLVERGFVIPFESGVVVVRDWRVHNYIDEKREAQSQYKDELSKLILLPQGNYELSEYSQRTLGKIRVDKSSIDEDRESLVLPNVNQMSTKGKPEASLSYLENIPEDDIIEFTNIYDLTDKQLKDKAECLVDYCRSHGKKYRNYKAFLRNAIRKDFRKRVVSPVFHYEEVPQEVKERNLARIAEMREKVSAKQL